MPVTADQARQLASLAAAMRPHGAKHWDVEGIVANLRKVSHLQLADVAMATIRAASNRAADNPGVIPVLTGEHWHEKVAERTTPAAPRRDESCLTCGRHLDACICGERRQKPVGAAPPSTAVDAIAACRAAIRPATQGDTK